MSYLQIHCEHALVLQCRSNRLYDQDEDTATLALAALMQSEPAALRAFTKLAAPESSDL